MHIRDDFQGGAPVSQVPASWFNSVAKFINSLIGGENVTLNKHDDGTESAIEMEVKCASGGGIEMDATDGLKLDYAVGTAVDNRSASEEGSDPEASTLTFTSWTKGGGNGLKMRLYALVDSDPASGDGHVFYPVDIEIAASGVVTNVEAPSGDHGVWIGA